MIVKSQPYVRDVVAYLAGALKQPALFNGLVDKNEPFPLAVRYVFKSHFP